MSKIKSEKMAQKAELVEIYDDFVEFNDHFSFFCDATSCLFTEAMDGEPDTHTVMGLKRYCSDLKERAEKLECALNHLYQQSYTGTQITIVKPST